MSRCTEMVIGRLLPKDGPVRWIQESSLYKNKISIRMVISESVSLLDDQNDNLPFAQEKKNIRFSEFPKTKTIFQFNIIRKQKDFIFCWWFLLHLKCTFALMQLVNPQVFSNSDNLINLWISKRAPAANAHLWVLCISSPSKENIA